MIRSRGLPAWLLSTVLLSAACASKDPRTAEADTGAPAAACPEPGPRRIAILGDRTGHPDDDVFFGILREIRRLRPDAIISVGDLIEGYQPDERIADAKDEWTSLMTRIRAITGDLPFFATAGNHDVWSDLSESLFAETFGHPVNVSLDMGSTQIILFDTSRYATEFEIEPEDLEWLWQALFAARDKKERVVITHKPLFALSPGGRYGAPLHDVFIAGRADMVIAGHWHHAMSDDRDDIQYRMIGPSGASLNRPGHPESGNLQQFGLLTVDEAGAEFSLVEAGAVMPGDRFSYELNQAEYRIEHRAVVPLGFDISAAAPASAGKLVLKVTNVTDERLDTTLSFDHTGWRVSPVQRAIALPPSGAKTLRFTYRRDASAPLFPGPALRMPFPWPDSGRYVLKKTIDPTLTLKVRRARTAPVIDGVPDEASWRGATRLGRFFDQRGPTIPGATEVKLLVVGDTLFMAAEMAEPDMAGQPPPTTTRDGFLEEEDHLVVWLDADPSTEGYVRAVVNAAGTVSDKVMRSLESKAEAMAWDGIRTVRTARHASGWTLELALPLGDLGWKGERRVGFNIARGRWRGGFSRIYWQPLLEHDNDSFGALLLR